MSPLGMFLWFAPILFVVSVTGVFAADKKNREAESAAIGLGMTAAITFICWLIAVGYFAGNN